MKHLLLIILIIFVLFFAFFAFDGFHFYDDIDYLQNAISLSNRPLRSVLNHPYEQAHRFGFLLPLAFFHSFLPFQELTHLIWNVLTTIGGITILYFWLEKYEKNWGLCASSLLGLDYHFLYLSNKVYPDTPTTVLAMGACIIIWEQTQTLAWAKSIRKSHSILWAFLTSCCLMTAFSSKLTVVFIFPFLSIYLVLLLIKPRLGNTNHTFIYAFITFSITFLVSYFFVYQYFTGDFLYRFHAVEAGRYADALSYFDKPLDKILIRLTYEPVLMFLKAGYFTNFCLALPVIFYVGKQLQHFSSFLRFWIWLTVSMLLFYWFGTTSLEVYSPFPLDYRLFVILSPFLSILALIGLLRSLEQQIYVLIYTISFGIGAIISYFLLHSSNWIIYLCLSFLFLGLYIAKSITLLQQKPFLWQQRFGYFFCICFFTILHVHPVFTMINSNSKSYYAEKHIVQNYFKSSSVPTEIYTDSRLAQGVSFYYTFHVPTNLRFIAIDTMSSITPKGNTPQYVLLNWHTINYLEGYTGSKFPLFIADIAKQAEQQIGYEKISGKNEVFLYKIK